MKKTRVIGSVLILSMLLSLCGCNSDDKNVIAAADEYAQALISFDSDDITELMDDADKAEVILEELEEISESSDNMEKITAAILDSMTYEIDSESVQSSKKDKSAKADIVFTLVDYEAIYEDVTDDGGSVEDYIDALEYDDGENTTEIKISVSFTLKKDKWVVKDDKAKNIRKLFEFLDEIPSYSWGDFKAVKEDDFTNALKDVFGISDADIYVFDEEDYSKMISYSATDQVYSLSIYDDFEEATLVFDEMYDEFYGEFDDKEYEGTYTYYFDEESETGYILFDGQNEFVDVSSYIDGLYLYGGLYLKNETLVMVLSYDLGPQDGDSDKVKNANAFLNKIGYPLPY